MPDFGEIIDKADSTANEPDQKHKGAGQLKAAEEEPAGSHYGCCHQGKDHAARGWSFCFMGVAFRSVFPEVLLDLFLFQESYIAWIENGRETKRQETDNQHLTVSWKLKRLLSHEALYPDICGNK
jgi:hypothetical protein